MTPFLQHLITRHEPAAPPSVRPRVPARFEANAAFPEPMMGPGQPEAETTEGSFDTTSATRPSFMSTEPNIPPGTHTRPAGENDPPDLTQRRSLLAFEAPPIHSATPTHVQAAGATFVTPTTVERGSADTTPDSGADGLPRLWPFTTSGNNDAEKTERHNDPAARESSPRPGDTLLVPSSADEAALRALAEKWFRQKQSPGETDNAAMSRIRPGETDNAAMSRIRPGQCGTARQAPEPPAAEPAPTIKVTIGRIEVKSAPDRPTPGPAEKTSTSRKPRLSLDDFLKTKKGQA
jgi:hypothetical protein